VLLGLEGEPRLVAPMAHDLIVLLTLAGGHRLVGYVGDGQQGRLDPLLDRLEPLFLLLDLVGQRLEPRAQVRLRLALERAHQLAGLLLLRALRLARLDELAALGGERLDGLEGGRRGRAALRRPLADLRELSYHPLQIEHGNSLRET